MINVFPAGCTKTDIKIKNVNNVPCRTYKVLYTCQLKFLLNSYCKADMKRKLVLLLAELHSKSTIHTACYSEMNLVPCSHTAHLTYLLKLQYEHSCEQ